MSSVRPSLEADTTPLAGLAAKRSRNASNPHGGKALENFPDVLTTASKPKKTGVSSHNFHTLTRETGLRNSQQDEANALQDSLLEETETASTISLNFDKVSKPFIEPDKKRTDTSEAATPLDRAAELMSALFAKIGSSDIRGQYQEVGDAKRTPGNPKILDVASMQDIRIAGPANLGNAAQEVNKPKNFTTSKTQGAELDGAIGQGDGGGKDASLRPARLAVAMNETGHRSVDAGEIAKIEVKVIKVETSFAPAGSPNFATQLAKEITTGLDSQIRETAAIAGNPVLDPRRDVVKSIHIQLQPENLGAIKVTMHLRGQELKLKIEVATKEAEDLLSRDHQALKDLMAQAGYDVNDASISVSLNVSDTKNPQRDAAGLDAPRDFSLGQGGKQQSSANQESRNHYENMRGHHAATGDIEDGQKAGDLPAGAAAVRRSGGVFL